MNLLVDSCIWSLALRRRSAVPLSAAQDKWKRQLAEAIDEGRARIIGPIRQELLSGIRDAVQFERLRLALESFPDEPVSQMDYEEAARCYNLCRSRGVAGGPVDLLICAVALSRGWQVMTSDDGLLRCLEIIESAKR